MSNYVSVALSVALAGITGAALCCLHEGSLNVCWDPADICTQRRGCQERSNVPLGPCPMKQQLSSAARAEQPSWTCQQVEL